MAMANQHAQRVLRILDIADLFDSIVFCDYSDPDFACKPEPAYFLSVRSSLS